jgi:NAD(P)-dependent dehydrogenase (short-subunit alcohol dehydrogenase family)
MSKPVVLITGALTGIGRATAFAFAQEGARVVVSGRRDDAGEALAIELRATGAEVEFIRADVRHENDVQNLVDKTVARFGRLDVAVNNAGTEGKPGPVTEQTAESYAATFDTNVVGVVLSMKHELRVMQAQGSGSIVNLSSTAGRAHLLRIAGAPLLISGPFVAKCFQQNSKFDAHGRFWSISEVACALQQSTGSPRRRSPTAFPGW